MPGIFGIILGISMSVIKYLHLKKRIMKSIKLKVFFLALSFLAFSATFAQDTTGKKPKPDTSKLPPKHDTTSMTKTSSSGSIVSSNANVSNSSSTKQEDKVAAKKEETK
jgi:hypothetical protein